MRGSPSWRARSTTCARPSALVAHMRPSAARQASESGMTDRRLDVALKQFGPLGARIMREIWDGGVEEPFTVRSVQARMPELAYNKVLTILTRLAARGVLT